MSFVSALAAAKKTEGMDEGRSYMLHLMLEMDVRKTQSANATRTLQINNMIKSLNEFFTIPDEFDGICSRENFLI